MLEGFEDIEYDLSEEERQKLVPLFIKGFLKHIGKENAISNKQVREKLAQKGLQLTDSKVRAIIAYIRYGLLFDDYVLCSNSKGSYPTNDIEEIKRWIRSMEQRVMKEQMIIKKASDKLKFIIKQREDAIQSQAKESDGADQADHA